jgi:hypothetical protein
MRVPQVRDPHGQILVSGVKFRISGSKKTNSPCPIHFASFAERVGNHQSRPRPVYPSRVPQVRILGPGNVSAQQLPDNPLSSLQRRINLRLVFPASLGNLRFPAA